MLLIIGDEFAVHDCKSGEALWRNKITGYMPAMFKCCFSIFITKDIAGYLYRCSNGGDATDKHERDDGSKVVIFDTKSGELVGSVKMRPFCQDPPSFLVTKGSIICYKRWSTIFVARVIGQEIKTYEFTFPIIHFMRLVKESLTLEEVKKWCDQGIYTLYGFVANSNVLIGCYGKPCESCPVLFSLDLDVAFAAKSEEEIDSAFSLPLNTSKWNGSEYQNAFEPIFKTDRANGSIEIIGVMRERNNVKGTSNLKIDNYMFVTEMEYPKQC